MTIDYVAYEKFAFEKFGAACNDAYDIYDAILLNVVSMTNEIRDELRMAHIKDIMTALDDAHNTLIMLSKNDPLNLDRTQ